MNSYERTIKFVKGEKVDHPPFMPLVIEWASRQQGLKYDEFVLNPEVRAKAYLDVVEKFDIDCVLPDADFSEQLADFGQVPVWVEGTGFTVKPIINETEDIDDLKIPEIKPGTRQGNRIEIIRAVAAKEKKKRYIFGICIGPFTEYCNARGMENAMADMIEEPEALEKGMKIFFENGMNFIKAQMEAGADGIQIVEPHCSLISPAFYEEYVLPLHKKMVEEIQSHENGFARLHICGNAIQLMPLTLGTGTHIQDADSAVDLVEAAKLLGNEQVFCGNMNTTEELLYGKPEIYPALVKEKIAQTGNRLILSSGCDVPPDTSAENMVAFHDAVAASGR